jgi:LSD1 subclass zinc finger protein
VTLSNELKQLMVCPKCRGNLEFPEDQAAIRCLACRLSYPIVDDIPVLIVDQATPLSSAKPEGG